MSKYEGGTITRHLGFSLQVCVPADWNDDKVTAFANVRHLAGTENGWMIREEGDEALNGSPYRVVCAKDDTKVHIMLDC